MATGIRVSKLILKLPSVPRVPDKIRNGRLRSFFDFFANSYFDYTSVGKEVIEEGRRRPRKAIVIGSGLLSLYTAFKSNPDEMSFHDQLVSSYVEMGLVDPGVRNPRSYSHVHTLTSQENERILTRINFGFFSLILQLPVNGNCSLYTARCDYLKPSFMDYATNRIVDVGCFNTWWILRHRILDYDINPQEWEPKS